MNAILPVATRFRTAEDAIFSARARPDSDLRRDIGQIMNGLYRAHRIELRHARVFSSAVMDFDLMGELCAALEGPLRDAGIVR